MSVQTEEVTTPTSSQESLPSQDATKEPLLIQLLSADGQLPTRSSPGAAGYDLCSAQETTTPLEEMSTIATDIAVKLPKGTYGRVAPRSGLTVKHHLDVGAGVIDPDYTGNIGVVMFNHGNHDYLVRRGDRIAQLIIEECRTPPVRAVAVLPTTVRGEQGFGSTDNTTSLPMSDADTPFRKKGEVTKSTPTFFPQSERPLSRVPRIEPPTPEQHTEEPLEKSMAPAEESSTTVKPRVLDLFSGTGSVADVYRAHGYEVVTVDIDGRWKPDIKVDVRTWEFWNEFAQGISR